MIEFSRAGHKEDLGSPRAALRPMSMEVGSWDFIRGFSEGVIGHCVGSVFRLDIPAHMAYKDNGMENSNGPDVPPGADLIFEVTILSLKGHPNPGTEGFKLDSARREEIWRKEHPDYEG